MLTAREERWMRRFLCGGGFLILATSVIVLKAGDYWHAAWFSSGGIGLIVFGALGSKAWAKLGSVFPGGF